MIGSAQLYASVGLPKMPFLAPHTCNAGPPVRRAAHKLHLSRQRQIGYMVSSPPKQSTEHLEKVMPEASRFSTSLTSGWQSAACCPCPSHPPPSYRSARTGTCSHLCSAVVKGRGWVLVMHSGALKHAHADRHKPASVHELTHTLLLHMVCRQPSAAVGLPSAGACFELDTDARSVSAGQPATCCTWSL